MPQRRESFAFLRATVLQRRRINPKFNVYRNPARPGAEIRSPRSNASIVGEQTLLLEGEAYDVEDGLLADAGLTWNSNRNGDLGTGRSLAVSALTLQRVLIRSP